MLFIILCIGEVCISNTCRPYYPFDFICLNVIWKRNALLLLGVKNVIFLFIILIPIEILFSRNENCTNDTIDIYMYERHKITNKWTLRGLMEMAYMMKM